MSLLIRVPFLVAEPVSDPKYFILQSYTPSSAGKHMFGYYFQEMFCVFPVSKTPKTSLVKKKRVQFLVLSLFPENTFFFPETVSTTVLVKIWSHF